MSAPQLRLAPLEPVKDGGGPQPSPKRALLRGALIVGVLGVVAVIAGYVIGPPAPPTLPEPRAARWSLADELGVDSRDEMLTWTYDGPASRPRGCYWFSSEIDHFAQPSHRAQSPYEEFSVLWGDIEVSHVVIWISDDHKVESAPESLIGHLDRCVADADTREAEGFPVFERTGSAQEQRFGWYESTQPSADADAAPGTSGTLPGSSPSATPEPHQSAGRYTVVDGWILVGVEASTTNMDVDVRAEADLDALLDALAAKVEADPITCEEWDGYVYFGDCPDPSQSPSPTPEPVREASG